MMDVAQQPMQEDRKKEARRLATERFQRESDWVAFYREVLGDDGLVDKLFPTPEQRNAFEKSPEFGEIQKMVAKLRERSRSQKQPDETTRVITVRLPKSLHDALRHEAHSHRTSMNKLCISKLLQVIDGELVPSDFERADDTESPTTTPAVRPQGTVPPTISPLMPMPSPAATTPSHHRPFGIPASMPSPTLPSHAF